VALITMPPPDVADWFVVYALVGAITGGLIALAVRSADGAGTDDPGTDDPGT
jgi:hypothetical protein